MPLTIFSPFRSSLFQQSSRDRHAFLHYLIPHFNISALFQWFYHVHYSLYADFSGRCELNQLWRVCCITWHQGTQQIPPAFDRCSTFARLPPTPSIRPFPCSHWPLILLDKETWTSSSGIWWCSKQLSWSPSLNSHSTQAKHAVRANDSPEYLSSHGKNNLYQTLLENGNQTDSGLTGWVTLDSTAIRSCWLTASRCCVNGLSWVYSVEFLRKPRAFGHLDQFVAHRRGSNINISTRYIGVDASFFQVSLFLAAETFPDQFVLNNPSGALLRFCLLCCTSQRKTYKYPSSISFIEQSS